MKKVRPVLSISSTSTLISWMIFPIIFLAVTNTLISDNIPSRNLIPGDSGFETEQLANTVTPHQSFDNSTNMSIENTRPFEGERCLKLEFCRPGDWVFGKDIDLIQGKIYTFSCYLRTDAGNQKCKIAVVNRGWEDMQSETITVTKEWQRFSLTFKANKHAYSLAIFWLGDKAQGNIWGDAGSFEPQNPHISLYVDAMQLEKGEEMSVYQNNTPYSIGIKIVSDFNSVFFTGEPIDTQISCIRVRPEFKDSDPLFLSWQITDFMGRILNREKEKILFDESGRFEKHFNLKTNTPGLYVINAHIEAGNALFTCPSMSFAVINPPVEISEAQKQFCQVIARSTIPGMQRIGARQIELVIPWNDIEEKKGTFNWNVIDQWKAYHEKGYSIKCMLPSSSPIWAMDKKELADCRKQKLSTYGLLPATEHLTDWRNFLKKTVERYKDVIDIWEIGAEADLVIGHNQYYKARYPEYVKNSFVLGPVTEKYAEMIKIASEEIRKGNPDAIIGAIRPSGVDCTNEDRYVFTQDVMRKIEGKVINALPLDSYCNIRSIGPGLNTVMPDDFLSEDIRSAQSLMKKYGDNGKVYISEMGWRYDKNIEPDSIYAQELVKRLTRTLLIARKEHAEQVCWFLAVNCGYEAELFSYGMWNHGMPMPVIPAFAEVAHIIENTDRVNEIKMNPNASVIVFGKKGKKADAAIWVRNGNGKFFLPPGEEKIQVSDVMGKSERLKSSDENIYFPIDEFPKYISIDGERAFERLSRIISSGKIIIAPLKINVVTPRIGRCFVALKNQSGENMKGTMTIQFKDGQEIVKENIDIQTNRDFDTEIPFAFPLKQVSTKAPINIGVRLQNGINVKESINLEFIKVPRTKTPVKIDGDLSDWDKQNFIALNSRDAILPADKVDWDGPADLSIKFAISWDTTYLYMAFAVTDDKHFNNEQGAAICNSDSIKLAIDPYGDGALSNGYDDNDYELAFAATAKGPAAYQTFGRKDILSKCQWAAIRDENTHMTFYELKLPLRALKIFPGCGSICGFSFMVPDDDGGGYAYWMESTLGTMSDIQKRPGMFKKLLFSE